MGKLWRRIRKGFALASALDTLGGWITPFLPKALLVAVAGIVGAVIGWLQGMTLGGALLFSLICSGVVTFAINQTCRIVENLRSRRFSPRHKELMLELAEAMADLKSLVLHPGNWSRLDPLPHQLEHSARYQVARTKLHKIAEEIGYDCQTRDTAVDFEHLCNMVVSDLLGRRDYHDHLAELERISGPIFRQLHEGKSINRHAIPWPQWILDSDASVRIVAGPA